MIMSQFINKLLILKYDEVVFIIETRANIIIMQIAFLAVGLLQFNKQYAANTYITLTNT